MANTSIHLPESLLEDLDRLAAERGVSRNRLIVESCRRVLEERSCWPGELFSNDHLTEQDLRELRQGERAFQEAIGVAARVVLQRRFNAAPRYV